jgi:hypothetical protein
MEQRTEWLELRPGTARPVATGTLACPDCDAPAWIAGKAALHDQLGCSYCGHSGALREFLSLARPTRPMHVVIRVR